MRKKTQYDKFLHEAQKQKMRELWDNSEDEAWKSAYSSPRKHLGISFLGNYTW